MKKAKKRVKAKPRKAASRGAVEATVRDLTQVSSLQAARIRELEVNQAKVLTAQGMALDALTARVNRLDPAGAPKEYAEQPSGDAAEAAGEPQAGEA